MREHGSSALLNRRPQHLPIPLGDLDVVRRRHTVVAGWRRRLADGPTLVGGLGLVAAMCGGVLAATAPTPTVGLTPGGAQVGGVFLPANAVGFGGGTRAAMVIHPDGRGAVIAVGNGAHDGVRVSGLCEMRQRRTLVTETCLFQVGAARHRAEDTLDLRGDGAWHRRYDDGTRIVLHVPPGGTVTPVPFPIGKP